MKNFIKHIFAALSFVTLFALAGCASSADDPVLKSIAVKTLPSKVSYFIGESLDTTGLVITGTYSDGSTKDFTSEFTASGFDSSYFEGTESKVQTITVTYKEKTTTYEVTILPKMVTSVEIKTSPSKTEYYVADSLDTTGLVLHVTFNTSETEDVSTGFTTSGFDSSAAVSEQTVTVTYGGKTVTFTVKILPRLTAMSFNSLTGELSVSTLFENGKTLSAEISTYKVQSSVADGKAVFNLNFYFNSSKLKGSSDFSVKVSSENGETKSETLKYEPAADFEFTDAENKNIFVSQAASLTIPEFIINYSEADYKAIWSYKSVTVNSGSENIEATLADFEAVKSFLSKESNVGNKVVLTCEIIPLGNESLKASEECEWSCVKDADVGYATLDYDMSRDCFTAKLWTDSTCSTAAGGNIKYDWQVSSDNSEWVSINTDNSGKYYTGSDVLNKYLRVRVIQTTGGEEKTPVIAESSYGKILGKIASAELKYEDIVLEENSPDAAKIKASSIKEKFSSEEITDCTISFQNSENTELYESGNVDVLVTKSGYLPGVFTVYISVKAVLRSYDYPTLLTDTSSIEAGMVQFASANSNLEYKFENGTEWSEITQTPFKATTGDNLFIRKKTVGVKNSVGYLEESDIYTLTVTSQNIGVMFNNSGINLRNISVSMQKSYNSTSKIWTFKAIYSEELQNYISSGDLTAEPKFSVDNDYPEYTSTITYSEDGCTMYVDVNTWPVENYNAFLTVTVKDLWVEGVTVLSAQESFYK